MLIDAGKDEEFVALAVQTIKDMFVTKNENKKKQKEESKSEEELKKKEFMTNQIIPLSPAEIIFFKEEFSKVSFEELQDKKTRRDFIKDMKTHLEDLGTALDIALFGRMVTSSVVDSPEGAMQVAHAISTHPVVIEQDIFTAVDDIISEGAGILSVAEYDSCAYYEYACLDYELLIENLGGDEERAKSTIPALVMIMAYANPSGKNTSTGTNILPSAMMIEKKAVPYNLVNAFVKPSDMKKAKERETGHGYIYDSVKWLADECNTMQQKYGIKAERYWFSVPNVVCENAENINTFEEIINKASSLV